MARLRKNVYLHRNNNLITDVADNRYCLLRKHFIECTHQPALLAHGWVTTQDIYSNKILATHHTIRVLNQPLPPTNS